MSAFRIAGFSGLVPRLAKQLLAPSQAQVATNCRLTSGDLRPRDGLLPIYVPVIERDIVSMFRMEKEGNGKWLAWDKDVDVARSPVAGNASRRFYYTGDGEPRVSDYDTATAGAGPYPSGCYVLGVTPPKTAPAVLPSSKSGESGESGASGTTGMTTTRSYVYTFVTQWGEESKPSPPSSVITGSDGDTWMLSAMDDAPPNSGILTDTARDTPAAGQVEVTLDTVFGLRAGEEIRFASVAGMTDLNASFRILRVDAATRKIAVALATRQGYLGWRNLGARRPPQHIRHAQARLSDDDRLERYRISLRGHHSGGRVHFKRYRARHGSGPDGSAAFSHMGNAAARHERSHHTG